MIADKELRRGNFVAHAHEGALIVTGTGATGFAGKDALGNQWKFNYEDVDGIPLTAELLESLGFKKTQFYVERVGIGHRWEVGKFSLLFHEIRGVFYYPHLDTNLPFLHQLQNLFFDLTGEWLEIDIKSL
jgi:hypothetical protein